MSNQDHKYGSPELNCDIIMKGGITSGVVYPSAVCELAQTYRFKNVGGTSAGAIAAGATAAAEYGRLTGARGFETLEELPTWLSKGKNLQNLFQPRWSTWSLFTLAVAFLGSVNPIIKFVKGLITALYAFWPATLVAAAIDYYAWQHLGLGDPSNVAQRVSTILAMVLVFVVLWFVSTWIAITYGLTNNGFGLCNGMDKGIWKPKPLTDWLTDKLDELAGIERGKNPLTFGDLWKPHAPGVKRTLQTAPQATSYSDLLDGHQDPEIPLPDSAERQINLRMVTSCITLGHPFSLPFSTRIFFFDEREMSDYFPRHVVQWLKSHAATPRSRGEALLFELLKPLVPLPPAESFPVVVAVRMSLSFPILLSAVPLHAVDYGLLANQRTVGALETLERDYGDKALDELKARIKTKTSPADIVMTERCWFSDGGISSNFPVQFFDTPLPMCPTFAIDLDAFQPDRKENEIEQCENVWMPESNHGGRLDTWNRFASGDRKGRLVGFLAAIFDTAQNWVDNAQAKTSGYRERVVHVMLSDKEGGLNLTMPEPVVEKLIARGKCAGSLLVKHYACNYPRIETNWLNHRWIRYRSFMAMFEWLAKEFQKGYNAGTPSFSALSARGPNGPPPSYRWANNAQEAYADKLADALDSAGKIVEASSESLTEKAPQPVPDLVVRPSY